MQFTRHALCVALLCGTALGARAEGARLTDAQLEDRFWSCDVASMTRMRSAHEGAQCVQWSDELKQRRFGGDFDQLLAWWRTHKQEEHARRLETPRVAKRSP
jgi:hypothetical protein